MTDPDWLTADVLVAAEVPAEQEQAVIEAFGALGVAVRSRVVPAHRGSVDAGWLLLATLRSRPSSARWVPASRTGRPRLSSAWSAGSTGASRKRRRPRGP
jgi:hypothetical protein